MLTNPGNSNKIIDINTIIKHIIMFLISTPIQCKYLLLVLKLLGVLFEWVVCEEFIGEILGVD